MKILRLGYVCDALWPVKIWLPPPCDGDLFRYYSTSVSINFKFKIII